MGTGMIKYLTCWHDAVYNPFLSIGIKTSYFMNLVTKIKQITTNLEIKIKTKKEDTILRKIVLSAFQQSL